MKLSKTTLGHIFAIVTILVWGTSFLASKKLLQVCTPLQLMFLRFSVAYVALWILYPHWRFEGIKELRFLLMALFSNTLYFLCESTALNLTQTGNVSVLVSSAPLLTAAWLCLIRRKEQLTGRQSAGFIVAFLGMVLVVFNGVFILKLNPLGDLLALGGGACWATYTVMLSKWGEEYDSALISRKMMFYGILTSGVLLLFSGQSLPVRQVATTVPLPWLLLYLGVISSCFTYTLWGQATKWLGPLKTGIYINGNPLVALVASALVFHERVTLWGAIGIALVIGGLILGTLNPRKKG